ncbi:hypothetical protein BN1050_00893 [Metalysinibacillus saudimassiliensis]|uniref:Uncharacterized protein n=1 Tax=Metalysinibacillus saudimassiliensis TaxID=1461583 RepID=A0A078M9R3_9BACL|nr:hypothetical protein BN1050_00893 [Metalysinibacillus saudimassiliensis]
MSKKGIIGIIIAAVVLIGGGAAFALLNKSPKQAYMLAEKENAENWQSLFEARYDKELDWYNKTQTEKSESDATISFKVPENTNDEFGMLAMLNSFTLALNSQNDLKEGLSNNKIDISMMGNAMGSILVGLNKHELTVGSSLTDTMKIDDKKLSEYLATQGMEDADIDFTEVFSPQGVKQQQEDAEYLAKHYFEVFFKSLDDKNFTTKKGDVEVYGAKVKAENIVMTLDEAQIRKTAKALLDEVAKDEKTKTIIERNIKSQSFGMEGVEQPSIEDIYAEIDKAREDIESAELPDEVKSSIWVNNKVIVSRDFAITDKDDTFTIKGMREAKKDNANFKYVFTAPTGDEATLLGELVFDGKKVNDMIEFTVDQATVTYTANEDVTDKNRIFERKITATDKSGELGLPATNGAIAWEGETSYEKDAFDGVHNFVVSTDDNELGRMVIDSKTKLVKKVEPMKTEGTVVDLSTKTPEEIDAYLEEVMGNLFGSLLGGM